MIHGPYNVKIYTTLTVMNVKLRRIIVRLWVTDVSCDVAVARWQRGGFLLSSAAHCRECLSRKCTCYITQRRKVIGLTRIIEVCYVCADGYGLVTCQKVFIMFSRFIWLQIVQGKSC